MTVRCHLFNTNSQVIPPHIGADVILPTRRRYRLKKPVLSWLFSRHTNCPTNAAIAHLYIQVFVDMVGIGHPQVDLANKGYPLVSFFPLISFFTSSPSEMKFSRYIFIYKKNFPTKARNISPSMEDISQVHLGPKKAILTGTKRWTPSDSEVKPIMELEPEELVPKLQELSRTYTACSLAQCLGGHNKSIHNWCLERTVPKSALCFQKNNKCAQDLGYYDIKKLQIPLG